MSRLLFGLLLLVPSAGAWAQRDDEADDAPIPYQEGEVEEAPRPARPRAKRTTEQAWEDDRDTSDLEIKTGRLDDPNYGLSGEFMLGAMLLDPARGTIADPRFGFGVRITWEYGRLLSDEFLREIFFADLGWAYAVSSDGTAAVRAETRYHYITLAPAFALRFGRSPVAAFAQVGLGINVSHTELTVGPTGSIPIPDGAKFLFQYGIGLRFRPIIAVVAENNLRLSFRIELTRFVRGYMHDTFLGGSIGLTL
jgi:hypothetical protein